jgi:hypothetical protein
MAEEKDLSETVETEEEEAPEVVAHSVDDEELPDLICFHHNSA